MGPGQPSRAYGAEVRYPLKVGNCIGSPVSVNAISATEEDVIHPTHRQYLEPLLSL